MNEKEVENYILDNKRTAPRLNPDKIDATINSVKYHVFDGTQTTVCCIVLLNGFTVIGESACASPENFDMALGRKIALDNARSKIWALEGYLLKQKLYENKG